VHSTLSVPFFFTMAMFSSTSMKMKAVLVATSIASSGALRERPDRGAIESCEQFAEDTGNGFARCKDRPCGACSDPSGPVGACSDLNDEALTITRGRCCCEPTFQKCGGRDELDVHTRKFGYSGCFPPNNSDCPTDKKVVKRRADNNNQDQNTPGCCCTITDGQHNTRTIKTQTTKTQTTNTQSNDTQSADTPPKTAGATLVSVWTSGCILLLAFLVSVQGLKVF